MDGAGQESKKGWLPDSSPQNTTGRNAETSVLSAFGAPSGIRTRVAGLKGRYPRPA